MAAITSTRNVFFSWPDEFLPEFFSEFSLARQPSPATCPKISRSVSFGSPKSERQEPKSELKKAKSVHFADSKGLALVSVLFFNAEKELQEEFSKYAAADRKGQRRGTNLPEKSVSRLGNSTKTRPKVRETQLVSPSKIASKVKSQKVCLEKTEVLDSSIKGTVCVHNVAFEKAVVVRYTVDDWRSQQEVHCVFHSSSHVDEMDRFVFEITPGTSPPVAKNFKVQFAVCYTVLGDSFWDNNNGFNYHVLFAQKQS